MNYVINSIKKGKVFERICVKLMESKTGVKWHRTSGSGAMHTAQHIEDNRFKGDIFCEDENWKAVVIECKVRKNPFTISDIVNEKSEFWEFVSQTEREAGNCLSILLFKWNNGKVYGLTNSSYLAFKLIEKPRFISKQVLKDNVVGKDLYYLGCVNYGEKSRKER